MEPRVHTPVCLTRDLPHLSLKHGEQGVIISVWAAPADAFEVEFHSEAGDGAVRALLTRDQIEVLPSAGASTVEPARAPAPGTFA